MLRHGGILILVLLFLSCFPGKKSKTNILVTESVKNDSTSGPEMIASLDCTTCHRLRERQIGPAFYQVSLKYEATEENIQKLVNKIKTGGKGVWGEIPMTPHYTGNDSLRTIVKYILSLKDQKD